MKQKRLDLSMVIYKYSCEFSPLSLFIHTCHSSINAWFIAHKTSFGCWLPVCRYPVASLFVYFKISWINIDELESKSYLEVLDWLEIGFVDKSAPHLTERWKQLTFLVIDAAVSTRRKRNASRCNHPSENNNSARQRSDFNRFNSSFFITCI